MESSSQSRICSCWLNVGQCYCVTNTDNTDNEEKE